MRYAAWMSSLVILLIAFAVAAQTQAHKSGDGSRKSSGRNSEAEIRDLYDRWAKAFRAHDLEQIMALYAPGDQILAYDLVAPLQYVGNDAYRKDYTAFL